MGNWTEPKIVVNGHELNFAQAMSVRVAVGHFIAWCREHQGTLPDYPNRLAEVEAFMQDGPGIPKP